MNHPPAEADPLRAAAEAQLAATPAETPARPVADLLHELQVHQIELEMQNETLRKAQSALVESHDRYVDLYDFAPVGYLTLDANGMIKEANLTCAALLGEYRKSLLNRRFASFVAPEDDDLWHRHFIRLVQDGEQTRPETTAAHGKATCELTLQRGDGGRFHHQLDCLYLAGTQPLVRIALSDISESKRAAELAAELASAARYQALIEHMHAGLVVHAPDTRILLANTAATKLLGLTQDKLMGKCAIDPAWHFLNEDGVRLDPTDYPVRQVLTRNAEIESQVLGVRRVDNGGITWLLVDGYPERDALGEIQQVIVTFVDITARKKQEALLREDREHQAILRELLEHGVKGGSLEESLGFFLKRLMEVSWLLLQPKGGILLLDKDRKFLRMTVSSNLSPEILSLCERVALGYCHCGVAAASGKMQFSSCVDGRHEISYPGMEEHGHYNLPLISEAEVLGVIVLYLPHGFERDPVKEQFLWSVADILAGFIRRKQAETALQRLNEQLEERVQLRTVELLSTKVEAERANRAKSEFLSRMSHELRTPLNAILGFGQLLERDNLPGVQADNVQEVLHAGRHLLELINEVLDLARIESGKFTLSLEPVPLLPLIADCVSLMRPQAENWGIDLIETVQDCRQQVRADRTRLKQVLLNLLSNAVKYNRHQGAINVTSTLQEDAVQIRIRDTGAGLTAEQQARLFVPFERLDADQRAIEGTGIGLALSKRLVELMGGSIGVESESGVGSTFWLTLPLADAAAEASDSVVPASAALLQQALAQRQFDILCIEDNPANLRLVERILAQRSDIRLLSASAPGLGLELAAAHRPSLILLDINLPDMDGYEVLRRLQANPATRSIPVLGISANAMPKDIERALAAGFADYLTKPLDVGQFMAAVDIHLANSRGAHG
jgi:PAS domain S-box-containing protein